MTVISSWGGAVTTGSALVVARVTGSSTRLAVSTDPELSAPMFFGPVSPTAEGVASLAATGLAADTRYWWAVEDDSALDSEIGTFHTHPTPGQPASFTFIASGDAGLFPDFPGVSGDASNALSNHPVFDTIAEHPSEPLFLAHLGDMHYYDLGSGNHGLPATATAAQYQSAFDDVLAQPAQQRLYRAMPLVYVWDDHDFGPDNSDRTHAGRDNACTVYRERVPSYPLAAGAGANPIYHSFQVGRVLFVVSDSRADRDPNADVDDAEKTMLGGAQKAWLRSLLEMSDAQALIWFMPTPWIGTLTDNWGSFTTERAELAQMLADTGWANRTVMITADQHALALETGLGGNAGFGGFPIMMVGSLDATPGTPTGGHDLGFSSARAQYGVIDVQDLGDQIRVTLTGWTDETVWQTHLVSIDTEVPPPPPEPDEGLPDVGTAKIRTRMTWLGCDLVTGRRIAELHDITGPVSRLIGAYTSANLSVPIPLETTGRAPLQTVLQATNPAVTLIVAVVNDLPIWAGIPPLRERGTDADMPLGCVTIEGYLDRRYVGDHDLVDVDEATIAATLVGDANIEGIGIIVDAPLTGTLRTRQYADHDDVTVYQRLQELSQVQGGPEWVIDLDWTDDTNRVVQKIFRLRKRLGTAADPPTAVFQTTSNSVFQSRGGSEARYRFTEDRTDGRYANHVVAVGSGEGEDRVQSVPARDEAALSAGQPRWESRIRPSTSTTSLAVLDGHAAAELARRKGGANTWKITARWDAYPRMGIDWKLGDDIGWRLFGHGHPTGVSGQGRAIGFELDPQAGVLSPILLEPNGEA